MIGPVQPAPDKNVLKQSLEEALNTIQEEKTLIKDRKAKKILIVSQGRSGSTLLTDFLYSYPGITTLVAVWWGEASIFPPQ